MSREETMRTRVGEMLDMMDCMAIDSGGAEEKQPEMTMEEILQMR